MSYFYGACALAAFILALQYVSRTGWLRVHGNQGAAALLTRCSMTLFIFSVAASFLTVALSGNPFLPRCFVALALVGGIAGHYGLSRGGGQSPT